MHDHQTERPPDQRRPATRIVGTKIIAFELNVSPHRLRRYLRRLYPELRRKRSVWLWPQSEARGVIARVRKALNGGGRED
jgi:hypothetical protein